MMPAPKRSMVKRGRLRLPVEFEEALSDLLKVKPPQKPETKPEKKPTARKAANRKNR